MGIVFTCTKKKAQAHLKNIYGLLFTIFDRNLDTDKYFSTKRKEAVGRS